MIFKQDLAVRPVPLPPCHCLVGVSWTLEAVGLDAWIHSSMMTVVVAFNAFYGCLTVSCKMTSRWAALDTKPILLKNVLCSSRVYPLNALHFLSTCGLL